MPAAKAYIVALAVGVLVGAIYGLLGVRSPAPPVVALVGLLGMLLGEQIVPLASQLWQREPAKLSEVGNSCARHLFGALPGTGLGARADVTPKRRSSPPDRPT
jgi:XapX domain-containing protein